MTTEEENVPFSGDISVKLRDSIRSSQPPIASPFLQAKMNDIDENDDEIEDFFSKSNTMRIIAENTPTDTPIADDEEMVYDHSMSNVETANKSMNDLIESQKKMIDKLTKQLKERDINYKKTLKNTINKNEIEMNELRIEIERLYDENQKITQLQAENIALKQKISKYERIKNKMNSKRSKALPTLPSLPINNKKTTDDIAVKQNTKTKKILLSKPSLTISKSADLESNNIKETKKKDDSKKNSNKNTKLIKYEKMKKIGMPFQSIINKMRMDQCSQELIAEFKGEKLPNNEDSEESDDSDSQIIDTNHKKFDKYKKMKKIKMPQASIINKMRMDGLTVDDITAFQDEILNGKKGKKKKKNKKKDKKSEMNQLAIEMGLKPKIEVFPKRVRKLKRIHWKIIELKELKGTIWEKFAKKYTDQDIGIDAKFELQFQIRSKKPQKNLMRRSRMIGIPGFGNIVSNDNEKKKKRKKIKWLESKRDQMIQIGLKKVGLSNEVIFDGISEMDEDVMSLSILETLFDLLPSKDEQIKTEEKIEEIMKEDVNNEGLIDCCGRSEMFFVEISAIPECKGQVTKWLFCRTFKEIYSHRMQQSTMILRATQAIKLSKALHCYLRILLAIGNLMNHGTEKTMAYGFNLDCLKMLEGIKDFSGKKSLAMFVYEFAYNKLTATHHLEKELKIIKSAARMETNIIEQSVKSMNDEFHKIDVFCRKLADDYIEGETLQFREYMKLFMKQQKSNMSVLKTKLKNAKTISRTVCKYYGYFEMAEEDKPEELFKVIQQFIDCMDKAQRSLFDLEKERIKLQQKRKREREKIKKKKMSDKVKDARNNAKSRKPPSRKAAPSRKPIPARNVKKMINVNVEQKINDDFEEEEEEETPLRNHFRKQTANFAQQQLDIGSALNQTLKEKQLFAKGKITQSLKNNHIKQQSIMESTDFNNNKGFGMDDIAKLINQELNDEQNHDIKPKNKHQIQANNLFVPNS